MMLDIVMHTGTWNGLPVTAAAGVAACKCYLDGNVHDKVNALGAAFITKGNELIKQKGIDGLFYGRSLVHLYLGTFDFNPIDTNSPPTRDIARIMKPNPAREWLCLHLLYRHISTIGARLFIFSSAHMEHAIDQTIAALADSFDAMMAEGSMV